MTWEYTAIYKPEIGALAWQRHADDADGNLLLEVWHPVHGWLLLAERERRCDHRWDEHAAPGGTLTQGLMRECRHCDRVEVSNALTSHEWRSIHTEATR